ncbi:hypothetical protein Krac_4508 [Ktedonobacter racemifer DSM 44963]|uniref:Uncharacterized protein n=1 Tax=Ktedonobacter racemifer DSM 44963 TaxID=485913 RepID=D6TSY1_KTERA|nr:hypothetical protein Krac_4508 [Ktedonobacter racemifer DSM 44963]
MFAMDLFWVIGHRAAEEEGGLLEAPGSVFPDPF